MNLFKVFASARKGFQEEYASAILAWLLNPALEHGLGFAVLAEFVGGIAGPGHPLHALRARLVTRMRTDDAQALRLDHHIELFVPGAFVDVVVVIGDWVLAVENKIFTSSVERGQLTREYQGLRRHYGADRHIAMVYLVPLDRDGPLDPEVVAEFDGLAVAGSDTKHLVTWQAGAPGGEARPPSVEAMIRAVLESEARCEITPVTEYARHTLKAFCRFIADDFAGYDYDPASGSGLNPATEEKLTAGELAVRDRGFVGVQYGLAGLILSPADRLATHRFQYATADMSGRRGWLEVSLFNDVVRWLRGSRPEIVWNFPALPAAALDRIAADYPNVHIGIRGGKAALEQMTAAVIREKKWRVRPVSGGPEWVSGTDFHATLRDKGVGGEAEGAFTPAGE